MINEKLLEKYYQMNKQSTMRMSREDENSLYVKLQYKGTCTTFRRCSNKGEDNWHIEGDKNIPTFHYCNNIGDVCWGAVKKYVPDVSSLNTPAVLRSF